MEIQHEYEQAFAANWDTVTFCSRCWVYSETPSAAKAITATGSAPISKREAMLYRQSQARDSHRQ